MDHRRSSLVALDLTLSLTLYCIYIVKEDGTLVLAGSAYEENKLPTTAKYVGQNGSKRIQTIFVLSTVIGELANISCTFFYNPRCDFFISYSTIRFSMPDHSNSMYPSHDVYSLQ